MDSNFPKRLRELRIRNGKTQAELAKQLNKAESTVRMWELGKNEPDFEMLEAIADIFNVDMNTLFGNNTSKEENVATKTDTFELIGADGTRIELNDREYDAALAVIKAVRKDREKNSNGPLDF